MMTLPDRTACLELDRTDPLAFSRERFLLEDGLIYLDGNSLGPLPAAVPERLQKVVREEWGQDLITSWNKHGWIDLPRRVGDRIGTLIGAAPGQVVAGDGTSVNIFKLLAAALKMNPGRTTILSDTGNFPTDLYMMQGLRAFLGPENCTARIVDETDIVESVDDNTAVVLTTHVNFRTGRMHDMKAMTKAVQDKGALMLWDLCHSAGAMPVDLDGCNADLAVGCSYKYLNGGPGAPAFLYVAERHQSKVIQPLSGWMGHGHPFTFDLDYEPAGTVNRYCCSTPSILSMQALDAALTVWNGVEMQKVREKSVRLCELFIQLVEDRCAEYGFTLATPREAAYRGSQVSFAHDYGYAIMQALIADKVIGDFRAPNLLRFGFSPLYISYVDVWEAVDRLVQIMKTRRWDRPEFHKKAPVT